MSQIKRTLADKLKDRYRLIIYNDHTFKEAGHFKLTGFNLLWLFGLLFVAFISLTFLLIAFTSVRELVPGFPDSNLRKQVIINALKLDSLEHEIEIRDKYFANLNRIISGQTPIESNNYNADTIQSSEVKNIQFDKSEKDSLLRKQIEEEEQFNLSFTQKAQPNVNSGLAKVHLFTPLRGIVTAGFNAATNHYGADIVAGPNEVIKATLDGTVISAFWTLETGYTITIQHENNLISIYKHNAELLKHIGSHVNAGEPIAIVGNTGELTTGPHLHFELWYNGRPVNPEDYLVF